MNKIKAFYQTTISDPDPKKRGISKKIIIEGVWDGEKFISHERYGNTSKTTVRKKEWIIFQCQSCNNMGSKSHTCPLQEEINNNKGECNCCSTCTNECNDAI